MANVSDIRIDVSLPGHRKFKRLKRVLGPDTMEYLIKLWCEVANQCPDGYLKGWDHTDFADAAGYDGKPEDLLQALIDEKWVDTVKGGYYPHDWHIHQPWVVKAPLRKTKASNAAKARWEKYEEDQVVNATSIDQACNEHASSNAPSLSLPILSSPSLTDKPLSPDKPEDCPHQKIIDVYHQELPSLPRVNVWSESSKKNLRARWREDKQRQSVKWWQDLFHNVSESDYLTGKVNDWNASLSWLVGPKNFEKVMNGNYTNHSKQTFGGDW